MKHEINTNTIRQRSEKANKKKNRIRICDY